MAKRGQNLRLGEVMEAEDDFERVISEMAEILEPHAHPQLHTSDYTPAPRLIDGHLSG